MWFDSHAPWQPIYQHWEYFWWVFIPGVSQVTLVVAGEVAVGLLISPVLRRRGPVLALTSVLVALGFPIFVAALYHAMGSVPQGRPFEWWPYWLGCPVFLVVYWLGFIIEERFPASDW